MKSVILKFNIGIAAVLIVVMALSAYITHQDQKRQAIENAKAKAHLLTQTVTNIIRIDMEGKNEKDLEKLIRVVGQFRDIETLRIFSPDGMILHSADPAETFKSIDELVMNVFKSGDMSTPFRTEEKGHLSFCRVEAIYNEPQCHRCHGDESEIIGILEVCLSMADTDKHIETNSRFMMMSTLATILIVGVAISLLAAVMVKKPITSLEKSMERASRGDLDVRAETGTNDEFASLGRSFNQMITKLDESGKEINRLHMEEMRRAERLASIGEMAASIAHEIKNPLAGLSGSTQILSKTFDEQDQRRKVTEEMLKLTGRLDKTINDLLKFARVNTPVWQMINPNDIVEETIYFIARDGKEEQASIMTRLNPEMVDVPMDPKLIQQVLFNLIINARQACKNECEVIVSTALVPTMGMPVGYHPGDFVEIKVSDNGTGIAPEILAEIWKPFYTTKVQGTGLGLPISRNIMEAHNGLIGVRSAPGTGTEFHLWLRKERHEHSS